jgi:hypothetical protein
MRENSRDSRAVEGLRKIQKGVTPRIWISDDRCTRCRYPRAARFVSFRSFAGAELLETRLFAQRVPGRIGLKTAARFAIGYFEQMRQSGDG